MAFDAPVIPWQPNRRSHMNPERKRKEVIALVNGKIIQQSEAARGFRDEHQAGKALMPN